MAASQLYIASGMMLIYTTPGGPGFQAMKRIGCMQSQRGVCLQTKRHLDTLSTAAHWGMSHPELLNFIASHEEAVALASGHSEMTHRKAM